ncbi:MAG TPA: flagellar biosynthetic protein FliQ [Vicinamibacterales bacterium]|jgi:flagellar biosynthetic protein FliQ|nr:flagellar biosynthetic protein FliQ [Vicinamibacterales bacterium]
MSDALVLGVVRQAIETAIIISLPMLAVGLIVGVLISILQTVTSIQDNILSFIPRAAAIFVVFAFTFPWMLRVVTGFAAALIRRLPDLVR